MRRYSLFSLFGLIALFAVISMILVHLTRSSVFEMQIVDLGAGYGKSYYVSDLQQNDIGALQISIEEKDIEGSPEWKHHVSNPPLSAGAALAKAEVFRKTRFREWERFEWSLISLNLTPLNYKARKWCWVACFELTAKPGMTASHLPKLDIYILMDGTIIEPDDPDGYLSSTKGPSG